MYIYIYVCQLGGSSWTQSAVKPVTHARLRETGDPREEQGNRRPTQSAGIP